MIIFKILGTPLATISIALSSGIRFEGSTNNRAMEISSLSQEVDIRLNGEALLHTRTE